MRRFNSLIDFNKQILFGETGALIGTPLAAYVAARFTTDPSVLSFSVVLGGLVAGSLAWLIVKIRDEKKRGANSVFHLTGQIVLFSPAAFVVGLIVYQPTLFLVARRLIKGGERVLYSALISQFTAFSLFLVAINLYRIALHRYAGKRI
jgi:hypothetical protein